MSEASDIPSRIRQFRKVHRESQTKFGARFNVQRLTVSSWENGTPPNRNHSEELAKLLAREEDKADGGFQLRLPFEVPIDVTLRISPRPSSTIHFDLQIKRNVG
jgi:transcriptional regulator with XRE-family HTH domain